MSKKDIRAFVFDELDYMQHFLCENFGVSVNDSKEMVRELVGAWV